MDTENPLRQFAGRTEAVKLRDYQVKCVESINAAFSDGHKTALAVMATGLGKCLGRGTPVMLHSGRIIPVEQVRPNDLLMGPDGGPRLVTSICCGIGELYRVTPKKGDPYTVNADHILSLKHTNKSGMRDFPSQRRGGQIENVTVKDYIKKTRTWRHLRKGWRAAIDFPGLSHLIIPPYMLGLWLGDGNSRNFTITTGDKEIISAVREYADNRNFRVREEENSANSVNLHVLSRVGNSACLQDALKHYDLVLNKHIPHDYKTGSREERLELLAGLIDSDGYAVGGCFSVTLVSERLIDDIMFVARSLGLAAYKTNVKKKCHNNGKIGSYWSCTISGNCSEVPVRLARKRCARRGQKKDVLVTGIRVDPIGHGEYFGFSISGPDRLFLLGDFTVTHNTVVAAHLIKQRMESGRCMFVAHREELINQAVQKIAAVTGIRPDVEMAATYAYEGGLVAGRNPIVVSSVQTQMRDRRRFRFNPSDFSLIITDEGHHAVAKSWRKVIDYYKSGGANLLGITATPDRTDKMAMGQVFGHVAFDYGILEGVNDGWLVPVQQQFIVCEDLDYSQCRTSCGDLNGADLSRVVEQEKNLHAMVYPTIEIANGRRTLFFAASIDQAKRITEIANRHKPGMARCVFGNTPFADRTRDVNAFRRGDYSMLVNVMIAAEGFDVPEIEVVAMGRATKSRALYTQMAGRATRPLTGIVDGVDTPEQRRAAIASSDKPAMTMLDFVGNSGRHKLISTLDILGGKYSEEVGEWIRKNQTSTGQAFDVEAELKRAEAELRKKKEEAEAKRREHIRVRAEFKARSVDAFNWNDRVAASGMPRHWFFRQASEKQATLLKRYGMYVDGMTIAQASKAIDDLKSNGWRRPAKSAAQ